MKTEPAHTPSLAGAGLLIGRAVCPDLEQTNWRGRVHSVFRRAVNVAVGDTIFSFIGEPLWISESGALARPATLAAAGPGSEFSLTGGRLFLDGEPAEDYRRATVWSMPELRGEVRADLLPGLALALASGPEHSPAALAGRVKAGFMKPAAAFARREKADFTAVVGAGPGLTPAGDDMLCGFALALASRAPERLPELAAACRPALGRTTDLSRHLLREALRGSFAWPLPNLLLALQGRTEFAPALELALSIGAGSGRDGAFGLYHGLRLL